MNEFEQIPTPKIRYRFEILDENDERICMAEDSDFGTLINAAHVCVDVAARAKDNNIKFNLY